MRVAWLFSPWLADGTAGMPAIALKERRLVDPTRFEPASTAVKVVEVNRYLHRPMSPGNKLNKKNPATVIGGDSFCLTTDL